MWSIFAFIIERILGIKRIFPCSFGNKCVRLLTRVYGIYSKTVRLPRDWLVQVLLVVKVSDGTMIAKTETVGLKAYIPITA